ncbi:hypothetical protein LC608_18105 [Nostoc sp. XA010]|nr:hypothetical protein [Nostoc sp. XA010]MCC5658863.1 hypothetical protein [Nostoc sp. XA010]
MNSQSQKKYNYNGISATYEGGGIYNGGIMNAKNTIILTNTTSSNQY